jgi:hypothetical protein
VLSKGLSTMCNRFGTPLALALSQVRNMPNIVGSSSSRVTVSVLPHAHSGLQAVLKNSDLEQIKSFRIVNSFFSSAFPTTTLIDGAELSLHNS